MSRRRAQDATRFSLFPFLAVLLCTMGSLIVLLLIVVQQSRVQAAEENESGERRAESGETEDVSQEDLVALRREAEQLAARSKELEELRGQYREHLDKSRLNLSHLEDHVRRLGEQYAKLEADLQILQQTHTEDSQSKQEKLAELARLRRQIEQAKAELDEAKRAADTRPRSYAIVPYEGPQGTRRRPIYIECRAEQLIIQPEGVVLLPDDFAVGDGAGNPLAAALRAAREYLVEAGSLQGGEPYPLLLVRPDGAKMYARAQYAMQGWSSEYGYELIDADMALEFPPADAAMGDVLRRTVNIARQRSILLARAHTLSTVGGPRRPGGGIGNASATSDEGGYFSVSRNGGFQYHGNSNATDEWLERHVGPPENPALDGSSQNAGGTGETGASGARESSGRGGFYDTQPPENRFGSSEAQGTGGTGSGFGEANSTYGQHGTAGGNPNGQSGASGGPNATQQGAQAAGGSPGGSSQIPSENASGSPNTSPQFGASNRAGAMGAMGSMFDETPPPAEFEQQQSPNAVQPYNPPPAIAQSRGENWALPSSARGATPFHRPIRVQCQADKLVVLPDRGTSERAKVTPVHGALHASIDKFVADLWQHMNGWGIAGPQAYWKPVLSVEVAPGGETRFHELAALMQKSGVEVQRKD